MSLQRKNHSGFTIVELLIVIVVIGILATISIVGYGSWRTNLSTSAVKSDLNAAAGAMEDARTSLNNGYPSDVHSTTYVESDNVDVTGGGSVDKTTFCLDGTATGQTTIKYYIDSSFFKNGAKSGTCALNSSIAVPAKPTGFAVSVASSTSVSLTWTAVSGATSYKTQCANDSALLVNLVTATSATNSKTVTGLTTGTTFCRVNAKNANGTSAWSDIKQVTTS